MVIVESADDPLSDDVRSKNILDPVVLVQAERHIAVRNLEIVPKMNILANLGLLHVKLREPLFGPPGPPGPPPPPEKLLISRVGLASQDTLDLLLPLLGGIGLSRVTRQRAHLTSAERAAAIDL